MGSFDAERLSKILVRAQGERTRQRYAMDAGISLTYLSNLIKGRTVGPPSPAALRKLAVASGGATSFQELMDACGHQEGSDEEEREITARERDNYTRIIHRALEGLPVEADGDTLPTRVAEALRRQMARYLEPLGDRPATYSSRAAIADFLFRVEDTNQLRRLSRLFESINAAPPPKTSISRLLQYAMDNSYTPEDFHIVANLLNEIRMRDEARRG